MKRIKRHLFIAFFLFHYCSSFSQKGIFYISLSGNDNWSGKLPEPDKNKSDGPFKTFERAQSEIKKQNEDTGTTGQKIIIYIRGGIYTIDETIRLSAKTIGKGSLSVTWKNYQTEKVELVGGKEITKFQPLSDEKVAARIDKSYRDKIYQVDLKSAGINDFGTVTNRGRPGLELFFNNKKMTPARWPNEGWTTIADVPQSGTLINKGDAQNTRFGIPTGRHYGRFTYSGNRQSTWSDIKDISLHGYWVWNWYDEYLNIASIDTVTKEIFIKEPHSNYGYCKEQRYYAVNVVEELDQPGEWYIDRSRGLLFFWPPSSLESGKAFVSLLNNPLVELDNVSDMHFEGISFAYSRGNGIIIKGGNNNLIAGCIFNNLGDIAVHIDGGIKNGVSSSDIHDVALAGVKLDGGDRKSLAPAGNFVTNCHIYNIGQWVRTYQSAIDITGVGNYIAHNLIHDGPGTGILLDGNEHIIEYNELHHLALETADVGAFYMGRDWTQRGNIIRYNYFHDLQGPGAHDVNAVYLDDWTSGTTVQGNIFSNCARGVMIGGGRDNIVSNNIFVGCHPAIHVDSRGLGWAKHYFDGTDKTLFTRMDEMNFKEPPYSVKYPELLSLYNDEPAVAKNNKIVTNIFYKGRWIDLHDGLDFEIVSCRGNLVGQVDDEKLSCDDFVVKDNPGINNYAIGDFRLKPKAKKYGFKEIMYKEIGLQRDIYRSDPPKSLVAE